jgi:hypothetical protein
VFKTQQTVDSSTLAATKKSMHPNLNPGNASIDQAQQRKEHYHVRQKRSVIKSGNERMSNSL